jgi:hypothetical protein
MFKLFQKGKGQDSIKKIAEKELKEKRDIIESLRDYDTGKKIISTTEIERRLPDIRVTP